MYSIAKDFLEFFNFRGTDDNMRFYMFRSSPPHVLCEKVFLEISQNPQDNTFARASFLIKLQACCNFIKKETLAQVFSCDFCEISKNNIFHRTRQGGWLLLYVQGERIDGSKLHVIILISWSSYFQKHLDIWGMLIFLLRKDMEFIHRNNRRK